MPGVDEDMVDAFSAAAASWGDPAIASMGHGLFFGVIFSVAVLNVFFYLSIRDRSYLYYVFYQLCFAVLIATDRGVLETLFGTSVDFSVQLNALAFPLCACCFAAFERRFLKTRQYLPRFDRVIVYYMVFVAVAFIFIPFSQHPLPMVHRRIVALTLPLFVLLPGIVAFRRGYAPAKFYLIAMSIFCIGPVVEVLTDLGVLPYTVIGDEALQLSSAIEAVLLTIALAVRMRTLQAQREQLIEEKTLALGQLMAGIAHEINNPNNFIHFNLPILEEYLDALLPVLEEYHSKHPDWQPVNLGFEEFIEDAFKLIDNLKHGSNRITHLVSELRSFVRKQETASRVKTPIAAIVERAVMLTQKQVAKSVKQFKIDIADQLPDVVVERDKIEQVLINLIINAAHAANKADAFVEVTATTSETDPRKVRVCVRDNGAGIPKENMNRIFEPFYTTKGQNMGTGLGLAVSYQIVESHGSRLTVTSGREAGTCFAFELPCDPQKESAVNDISIDSGR
jgi:signal transduction histidine kinase